MSAPSAHLPAVDVAVPCYNYAHYLEGCVQSVLSQRDVAVRVLIIDDQSPDDTPAIAARLTAGDSRVEYTRNENNLGLIGSANLGVMEWASADYVVLLSADDLLAPGALARATRLMNAHPDVGLAYGMALVLCDDGPPLPAYDPGEAPSAIIDGASFVRRMFEQGNFVPSPSAVMRTSLQRRIGPYDARFKHTSDLDMWLRAAAEAPVGAIDAVQSHYRLHAANMSFGFLRRALGDRRELLATYRGFARSPGRSIPGIAHLLRAVERRMCREALEIANTCFGVDDEAAADAAAFARGADPLFFLSPQWTKLQIKRGLGKSGSNALRGLRRGKQPPEEQAPYRHGAKIGWWPQP